MTTSELFCGCYVSRRTFPDTIWQVHSQISPDSFFLTREGSASKYVAHLSVIEGIPITREWLDRLGVEHDTYNDWWNITIGIFGIVMEPNAVQDYPFLSIETETYYECEILHVHRLQGLVLHLTGKLLSVVEPVTA